MQNNKEKYNIFYPPGGILLWIIIFLELITFGLALIAFKIAANAEPEVFYQSQLKLNTGIGTANTVILIISGFFIANAVIKFKENNKKEFLKLLNLTILGGVLFIVLKSVEYYLKIKHNYLVDTNTFFTFYWLLTLFHLIHVVVGLVILFVIKLQVKKEKLLAKLEDIEAAAAFWHMCDLIWLLLFPVLYLLN